RCTSPWGSGLTGEGISWAFGCLEQMGESAHNWEEVLKDLRRRGVRRVRIFVTDDLPGLEEAIKKMFPDADWQLHVLHAVRDALNKARRRDREALAEALKKIYRAEMEEEAKGGLGRLRERWGEIYPRIVECPVGVSPSPQAYPTVSVHHEPTGTVD
ncbi:MAG: transposase, partial [Candidatus Caldatribacterium sp.]|nr:transposase [Candidatus Caldatribacterium sp.]